MHNYSSGHFALRARLLRRLTCYHAQYLSGRRVFPLRHPSTAELSRVDANFQTLKTLEPVPPKLKLPPCPLWISLDSIRFIDNCAAMQRNPCHSCNVERGITRAVRRYLMAESQIQAEEAAI